MANAWWGRLWNRSARFNTIPQGWDTRKRRYQSIFLWFPWAEKLHQEASLFLYSRKKQVKFQNAFNFSRSVRISRLRFTFPLSSKCSARASGWIKLFSPSLEKNTTKRSKVLTQSSLIRLCERPEENNAKFNIRNLGDLLLLSITTLMNLLFRGLSHLIEIPSKISIKQRDATLNTHLCSN